MALSLITKHPKSLFSLAIPQMFRKVRLAWKGCTAEEEYRDYILDHVEKGNVDSFLATSTRFHETVGFMMDVGENKGLVIDEEIKKKKPKVMLEFGTYLGYSSIRMARLLSDDAHIYTFEVNPANAAIAQQLIDHVGMTERITIVPQGVSLGLAETLKNNNITQVDMVFVDHWKDLYVPDVTLLESFNVLVPGSVVIADNVRFPGVPDYEKRMTESSAYDTTPHFAMMLNDTVEDMVLVAVRK